MSGILGVYDTQRGNVTDPLTYGLFASQNRGENGCGVATARHGIRVKKRPSEVGGIVTEKEPHHDRTFYEFLKEAEPFAGIGHTLYEKSSGLQPVEKEDEKYHVALAMDGVILGYDRPNDETLVRLFRKGLQDTDDIAKATHYLMEELDDCGFYNGVALVQNKDGIRLIAFRGPRGGRPLSMGKQNNTYVIASETQGLDGARAMSDRRDIEPGSVYVISEDGLETHQLVERPHAHCIFEWIYFASSNSVIEGRNVEEVRNELGRRLYERHGYRPDVLCPSPDSGRGCGNGYCMASGIPIKNWITKNRGAPRTFLVERAVKRLLITPTKFNINPLVRGKRIGIPEDSLVRGNVIGVGTVNKLKERGAEEGGALVSYAPMPFHCYRSDGRENMAAEGLENVSVEEAGKIVAERLGIDKVFYNDIEEIKEVCGLDDVCDACATGNYFFIDNGLLRFRE